MKINNIILGFMLALFLIIGTSATTISVMTVKPAVPKSTIIKSFTQMFKVHNTVEQFTNFYVKKGYVIKSIISVDKGSMIVILEKY